MLLLVVQHIFPNKFAVFCQDSKRVVTGEFAVL